MLLSLFLSFIWKEGPLSSERMFFFIGLASLASAVSPVSIGLYLTFPFTFLSFPFYGYVDPVFIWENMDWVDTLRIRFLTIDITSNMPMSGVLVVAFQLFLVVNILGSILGYKMRKKLKNYLENRKKKEGIKYDYQAR